MKTLTTLILIFFTLCCINFASAQWVSFYTNGSVASFTDVFFLNDNTGWVCQSFGGTSNIFKTTNAGANWVDCSAPGTPYALHFINDQTGFSIGYSSYKTTNGGANWTSISGIGENVCFVDNSTGWTLNTSGFIYKTTNTGDSWSATNLGNATLSNLYFLNSSTGWVLSEGTNSVLKTTNGGNSWSTTSIGIPAPSAYFNISFSDANNGRIFGTNTFLKTTNGGQSWSAGTSPANQFLDDQYFINSTTGWVTARFTGVYFTSNGGANWLQQSTGVQTQAFCFNPQGTGYICGSASGQGAVIYKTTNGGFSLAAPSNLTATPASSSQINLSWTDNSGDEDKFIIQRSPNGFNSWSTIDSVNAGVTTYSNTGLFANSAYYYRVYPKKLFFSGNVSNTSPFAMTLLDAPAFVSPSDNYIQITTTPTLAWSAASFANTYYLQVASDTGFSNVVYSTSGGGLLFQSLPNGILQNSTKYYWRVKCSSAINQSNYSAYRIFTVQDPNYGNNIQTGSNLYYFANSTSGANLSPSKPTYNWRDTTGSTSLIVNQTGSPTVGNLDNGYFKINNVFGGSNKTKFFGTDYTDVNIGTNGIVSFSDYSPTFAPTIEPTDAAIPQAPIAIAIFPFWADLYYEAPAFPSRLCYKVTANELIITYSKAIMYDVNHISNINMCISFQVIIHHSSAEAQNSKIEILYNYNETGWLLLQNLTNNNLRAHLIGMQGGFGESKCATYRFQNTTHGITYQGPIFGSDLALAFAPNVNALPVELASFTSSVNGSNAKLEWATVNELNNSGFAIERKTVEGNQWKKVGFVQGSGTTNQSQSYFFEDRNLSSGKYQYRLKQIDFNGNYEYFNLTSEIEIGVPKKFSLSQNYPNPFNPATKINFELPQPSNVKLSIYDVTGKLASELVNEQRAAGYYTVEFNGSNLASGMYFYRIQAGEFSAVKKMVLVK